MQQATYAVVSYLSGPLADFVNSLRHRLNPALGDWLAHVSILPPRRLAGSFGADDERLERLRSLCRKVDGFAVELSGVNSFWPINGVVYLSIGEGASRLVQLHSLLNEGGMLAEEAYGYIPHVTIAQSLDQSATESAVQEVQEAWNRLSKPARFLVESLVLVEQVKQPDGGEKWMDLAPIPLGSLTLASSR
jgi:2'-5' RNA ligase